MRIYMKRFIAIEIDACWLHQSYTVLDLEKRITTGKVYSSISEAQEAADELSCQELRGQFEKVACSPWDIADLSEELSKVIGDKFKWVHACKDEIAIGGLFEKYMPVIKIERIHEWSGILKRHGK